MFNSPEQALKFAFRIREKSIISKSHNVYQVKEKQRTSGNNNITVHDLHAQGAMIIGFVERLGTFEGAWVYWMYGDVAERSLAAKLIANRFDWNGLSIDREDIYTVMLSQSARKCAATMGISKNRAWRYKRRIAEMLGPIERRVLDGLWERIDEGNSNAY
jgi:hypothetical protein